MRKPWEEMKYLKLLGVLSELSNCSTLKTSGILTNLKCHIKRFERLYSYFTASKAILSRA